MMPPKEHQTDCAGDMPSALLAWSRQLGPRQLEHALKMLRLDATPMPESRPENVTAILARIDEQFALETWGASLRRERVLLDAIEADVGPVALSHVLRCLAFSVGESCMSADTAA